MDRQTDRNSTAGNTSSQSGDDEIAAIYHSNALRGSRHQPHGDVSQDTRPNIYGTGPHAGWGSYFDRQEPLFRPNDWEYPGLALPMNDYGVPVDSPGAAPHTWPNHHTSCNHTGQHQGLGPLTLEPDYSYIGGRLQYPVLSPYHSNHQEGVAPHHWSTTPVGGNEYTIRNQPGHGHHHSPSPIEINYQLWDSRRYPSYADAMSAHPLSAHPHPLRSNSVARPPHGYQPEPLGQPMRHSHHESETARRRDEDQIWDHVRLVGRRNAEAAVSSQLRRLSLGELALHHQEEVTVTQRGGGGGEDSHGSSSSGAQSASTPSSSDSDGSSNDDDDPADEPTIPVPPNSPSPEGSTISQSTDSAENQDALRRVLQQDALDGVERILAILPRAPPPPPPPPPTPSPHPRALRHGRSPLRCVTTIRYRRTTRSDVRGVRVTVEEDLDIEYHDEGQGGHAGEPAEDGDTRSDSGGGGQTAVDRRPSAEPSTDGLGGHESQQKGTTTTTATTDGTRRSQQGGSRAEPSTKAGPPRERGDILAAEPSTDGEQPRERVDILGAGPPSTPSPRNVIHERRSEPTDDETDVLLGHDDDADLRAAEKTLRRFARLIASQRGQLASDIDPSSSSRAGPSTHLSPARDNGVQSRETAVGADTATGEASQNRDEPVTGTSTATETGDATTTRPSPWTGQPHSGDAFWRDLMFRWSWGGRFIFDKTGRKKQIGNAFPPMIVNALLGNIRVYRKRAGKDNIAAPLPLKVAKTAAHTETGGGHAEVEGDAGAVQATTDARDHDFKKHMSLDFDFDNNAGGGWGQGSASTHHLPHLQVLRGRRTATHHTKQLLVSQYKRKKITLQTPRKRSKQLSFRHSIQTNRGPGNESYENRSADNDTALTHQSITIPPKTNQSTMENAVNANATMETAGNENVFIKTEYDEDAGMEAAGSRQR
ncbi:Uu.00g081620.m01.CDS01 [Anthostomella pinea]|uniref:Uu.00g081620.m01.CDS01 n=1 Tax=Anthostomella pinea TaxID=933095 RepID=A0AAI8YJB5_9PEZI|nr:Uu.00g081620.m01.CDS01 [Anthostomella pinea]